MEFTPKSDGENPFDVPYFDDVDSQGGWVGHTTGRSKKALISDITQNMTKLGATVIEFQEGTFAQGTDKPRDGFILRYTTNGLAGEIKIAALPVKPYTSRNKRGYPKRKSDAIRMALYMFNEHVRGMWYAQKLSPGYLPLVPFMLDKHGNTLSEAFLGSGQFAIGAGEDAIIFDGEFEEI